MKTYELQDKDKKEVIITETFAVPDQKVEAVKPKDLENKISILDSNIAALMDKVNKLTAEKTVAEEDLIEINLILAAT